MVNLPDLPHINWRDHYKLAKLLKGINSVVIDGKQVIQTAQGEFLEYVLMDEEYFVDTWLIQFAMGNVNGVNYFNQEGWNALTDGYQKGVIVLNKDQQPVVVIRKFTDPDLSVSAQHIVNEKTRMAAQAKFLQPSDQDKVIDGLAQILTHVTQQNPEYDTLTMMIREDYYLSKGINPFVVKQVIYTRDTYSYKGIPMKEPENAELLAEVEDIYYRVSRNEKITQAERNLINEITNGEFLFNQTENTVATNNSQPVEEKPYDPFSD
jgi:hypothetical protein